MTKVQNVAFVPEGRVVRIFILTMMTIGDHDGDHGNDEDVDVDDDDDDVNDDDDVKDDDDNASEGDDGGADMS